MCSQLNIISKTKNGIVFLCKDCDKYRVQFNNLDFSFNDQEYFCFSEYISGIDLGHFEHHFNDELHGKKIPIPIGHKNLVLVLNSNELKELQMLFSHTKTQNYTLISLNKINYKLFMNLFITDYQLIINLFKINLNKSCI